MKCPRSTFSEWSAGHSCPTARVINKAPGAMIHRSPDRRALKKKNSITRIVKTLEISHFFSLFPYLGTRPSHRRGVLGLSMLHGHEVVHVHRGWAARVLFT